jgi:hypothetical protein
VNVVASVGERYQASCWCYDREKFCKQELPTREFKGNDKLKLSSVVSWEWELIYIAHLLWYCQPKSNNNYSTEFSNGFIFSGKTLNFSFTEKNLFDSWNVKPLKIFVLFCIVLFTKKRQKRLDQNQEGTLWDKIKIKQQQNNTTKEDEKNFLLFF